MKLYLVQTLQFQVCSSIQFNFLENYGFRFQLRANKANIKRIQVS